MSTMPPPPGYDPAREAAIVSLRKKREFAKHILAYVTVNVFLVVIWLLTSPGGFFWPAFPILGWGIGLAFHAWDTFASAPTEERIQREMQRQGQR